MVLETTTPVKKTSFGASAIAVRAMHEKKTIKVMDEAEVEQAKADRTEREKDKDTKPTFKIDPSVRVRKWKRVPVPVKLVTSGEVVLYRWVTGSCPGFQSNVRKRKHEGCNPRRTPCSK
jgi:hypothetical protein